VVSRVLTVVVGAVLSSGCATTMGTPVALLDLGRVAAAADAFPSSIAPNLPGAVAEVNPATDSVGDFVAAGNELVVTPESCHALLKPVDVKADTDVASITSVDDPTAPFVGVFAYDPVTVPFAIPSSGCDTFLFHVVGTQPDGTVESLSAPPIDGAVTFGLKVTFVYGGSPAEAPLCQYFYVAVLDGRTFVKVWARVPADFAPDPVLPNLLSRTVTALRGR
jgi:hypothetical protein